MNNNEYNISINDASKIFNKSLKEIALLVKRRKLRSVRRNNKHHFTYDDLKKTLNKGKDFISPHTTLLNSALLPAQNTMQTANPAVSSLQDSTPLLTETKEKTKKRSSHVSQEQ